MIAELTLFRKVGRNVVLTAVGRDVHQATSQALMQLSAVVKVRRNAGRLGGRSLSVSLPPALGIAWLSNLIVEHAESHHAADVTINSAVKRSTRSTGTRRTSQSSTTTRLFQTDGGRC